MNEFLLSCAQKSYQETSYLALGNRFSKAVKMGGFHDAFISYGRADSRAFAKQLHDSLVQAGLKVWFDFEDIPPGVDYQKQIDDDIEKSDNFLFILSPHAVNSPYCALEVQQALQFNKRIIPILHVLEIDKATWQQRNPDGTEDDWQQFQSLGLHSSRLNLRPEVARLNWFPFEADQADLDQSIRKLIDLLQTHRPYVRLHTQILHQARQWEKHQKQPSYLLIGQDRQASEQWLKTRFTHELPPCIPTDLHCEFIVESIKNANNLMTQVFLCHAEADRTIADHVRRTLYRQGITAWSYRTDIQASTDYHQAINGGIEQADNLIYFLSQASLKSNYCQQELAYGLSLHKRIIPLLIEPLPTEQIPEVLQPLQCVDLTNQGAIGDEQLCIDQLLRTLATEATYYNEHKQLLAKALKWQRQHKNPAMLLRGYNLRHAEAWLKTAQVRQQHSPTSLQTEFINASLNCPPTGSLDVFIAYSRVDSDFARRLNEALQIQGKTTWFDQESIASGADFQREIHRGIETSHNILFILSPASVTSPYCDDEVTYAETLGKRILTILRHEINPKDLHRVLRPIQWIDFRAQHTDFKDSFCELLRVLDTDRQYLEAHTQLSLKALEWNAQNRDGGHLLRGKTLEKAEVWLAQAQQKSPHPTALHREYVQLSRAKVRAEKIKNWTMVGALASSAAIVTSSLILFSLSIMQRAQDGLAFSIQTLGLVGDQTYERNPESTQNWLNSLKAASYLGNLWSHREDYPQLQAQVMGALTRSLNTVAEHNILTGHHDLVTAAAFSPDGEWLVSSSGDGNVKLWQPDGQETPFLPEQTDHVMDATFSPDGQWLATAGWDGTAKIWPFDAENPQVVQEPAVILEGHTAGIDSLAFSYDSQLIATASRDGTATVWTMTGQPVVSLQSHDHEVRDVAFSPDNQWIATASADHSAKLWTIDGQEVITLEGHQDRVFAIAFHPDQPLIATASGDGTVRLWRFDGQVVQVISVEPEVNLYDVAFSPNSQNLVIASADNLIYKYNLNGQRLRIFNGHEGEVNKISFNPDGDLLASASDDFTVRLWLQNTNISLAENERIYKLAIDPIEDSFAVVGSNGLVGTFQRSTQQRFNPDLFVSHVNAVDFSPEGDLWIAGQTSIDSEHSDNKYLISSFNSHGAILKQLAVDHQGHISDLKVSPDNQWIMTASFDNTIRLLNLKNLAEHHFENDSPIFRANWFDNSVSFITADSGGMIKLWALDVGVHQSVKAHDHEARNVILNLAQTKIATSGSDGVIKIWRIENSDQELKKIIDKPILEFSASAQAIWGLAFSPDGQSLATSGDDGFIRIWDLDGNLLLSWMAHSDAINDIYFSQDGTWLFSVGSDGYGRKWLFQPDLPSLIQAGCERTVTFRAIDPDDAIDTICSN